MPDNDAVHCIVGQLKQIAEDKRNRKIHQKRHDFPSCQIFCHSVSFPVTGMTAFFTFAIPQSMFPSNLMLLIVFSNVFTSTGFEIWAFIPAARER